MEAASACLGMDKRTGHYWVSKAGGVNPLSLVEPVKTAFGGGEPGRRHESLTDPSPYQAVSKAWIIGAVYIDSVAAGPPPSSRQLPSR